MPILKILINGVYTEIPYLEGKSAYQSAIDGGYVGTEAQFYIDLANSEENVIEEVKVNNVALPITSKSVNVDLSGYLLKDTTLQTADTPEDTSLFSFLKIGVGRVKITWLNFKSTLKTYFDAIYVPLTFRFEKHTGFYSENDPRNKKILVTYNGDKTITLSRSDGTFQGYFEGLPIAGLTNGYTSPIIPTATPTGLWFLYHNGTSIIWSQTPFLFSYCMITIAYFRTDGTFLFIGPETHGFMPEADHEEFHRAIGAYSDSGNGVSGYTLNSTVATNRRPTFEAGVIADEDKHTDLLAMSSNYTRSWITSAGSITSDWNNAEIIPLNGNRPVINVITNGLGSQVDITNNNYCAVFVFKIAVGADADSQRYRCVILQPQHQGTLTQMQAVNFTAVNINGLTGISNEIIFTQKIIIRYTSLNWTITSIENISGNARFSVISSGATAGVNELNVSMDARAVLTGTTLDANADIINSFMSKNLRTIDKFYHGVVATGQAIKCQSRYVITGGGTTYIYTLATDGTIDSTVAPRTVATAGGLFVTYIPPLNEFWVINATTSIYRISATADTLTATITIATGTTRFWAYYANGYYYYNADGATIIHRIVVATQSIETFGSAISGYNPIAYTYGGTNYVAHTISPTQFVIRLESDFSLVKTVTFSSTVTASRQLTFYQDKLYISNGNTITSTNVTVQNAIGVYDIATESLTVLNNGLTFNIPLESYMIGLSPGQANRLIKVIDYTGAIIATLYNQDQYPSTLTDMFIYCATTKMIYFKASSATASANNLTLMKI